MSDSENATDDIVRVEVVWEFKPLGYFKEPFTQTVLRHSLNFEEEKVWSHLPPETEISRGGTIDELTDRLRSIYKLVEVETRRKVEVPEPQIVRRLCSGRANYVLRVEGGSVTVIGTGARLYTGTPEEIERKKAKERARRLRMAEQGASLGHDDPLLQRALTSFHTALRDAANEFIHLYDIREALKTFFGGDKETRDALGITKAEWNEFGKISNDEPIRQGRHRGKHYDVLRDATDDERLRARKFIRLLIGKYIGWLEVQEETGRESDTS